MEKDIEFYNVFNNGQFVREITISENQTLWIDAEEFDFSVDDFEQLHGLSPNCLYFIHPDNRVFVNARLLADRTTNETERKRINHVIDFTTDLLHPLNFKI